MWGFVSQVLAPVATPVRAAAATAEPSAAPLATQPGEEATFAASTVATSPVSELATQKTKVEVPEKPLQLPKVSCLFML